MSADFLAKMAIGLLVKLMSETFLAKVLIYTLSHWAKSSENSLDDKVVIAMADALGVAVDDLKKLPSK
jgi:preprotein translocase subunit SecF